MLLMFFITTLHKMDKTGNVTCLDLSLCSIFNILNNSRKRKEVLHVLKEQKKKKTSVRQI